MHTLHNLPYIEQKLQSARLFCQKNDMRFTPLRQAVYRLILSTKIPLGAYDLIDALQHEQDAGRIKTKAKRIAPPTIYRALDFLLHSGLVHQLSSINCFVPCCCPGNTHTPAFLICQKCRGVTEISQPSSDYWKVVNDKNFTVCKSIIELQGLCYDCQ